MTNIVLIGYKGSGKSYFGKLLAEETGKELIDTDHLVEEVFEGELSSRGISLKWGEAFFRRLERDVIHSLKDMEDVIISTGGGAILDAENRECLKRIGTCIYLKADKSLIKRRMLASGVPSFLDPKDIDGSFERMYKQRADLYKEVAEFEVDVMGISDNRVLENILISI